MVLDVKVLIPQNRNTYVYSNRELMLESVANLGFSRGGVNLRGSGISLLFGNFLPKTA